MEYGYFFTLQLLVGIKKFSLLPYAFVYMFYCNIQGISCCRPKLSTLYIIYDFQSHPKIVLKQDTLTITAFISATYLCRQIFFGSYYFVTALTRLYFLAFCIGHVIHSGLLIAYRIAFWTTEERKRYNCTSIPTMILDILYPINSFILLFFIFKYSNVSVYH